MTTAENKENEQKKQTCFADYVVDVPKIIVNPKKLTKYDCLQFLGSVRICAMCVLYFTETLFNLHDRF